MDELGFRALSTRADRLRFERTLGKFQTVSASDQQGVYLVSGGAWNPSKLRVNVAAPSFELYFPRGLALRLSSLQAPFLSWSEGSVGDGIPTPKTKWVLVSFRDEQPAVLLGFPMRDASLHVEGKPGDWAIRSTPDFEGWVRVALPFGLRPMPANDAAALGQQTVIVARHPETWIQSAPTLASFEARPEAGGVLGIWTYDRPGAAIPVGLALATRGGYPVELRSGVLGENAPLTDGPTAFCATEKLAVFFPMKSVPEGRALAVGAEADALPATISPLDPVSVSQLALGLLFSCADKLAFDNAESGVEDFLADSPTVTEPFTQLRLPFDEKGVSMELTAAHAVAAQSLDRLRGNKAGNSLLSSLLWAVDARQWMLCADDSGKATASSSMAAVAAALSDDPKVRVWGAMLQCGLASAKGYAAWRKDLGYTFLAEPTAAPADGFAELRDALYGGKPSTLYAALETPIRVLSSEPIIAQSHEKGCVLKWRYTKGQDRSILLRCPPGAKLSPLTNLGMLRLTQTGEFANIEYGPKAEGECSALLMWEKGAPTLTRMPRL